MFPLLRFAVVGVLVALLLLRWRFISLLLLILLLFAVVRYSVSVYVIVCCYSFALFVVRLTFTFNPIYVVRLTLRCSRTPAHVVGCCGWRYVDSCCYWFTFVVTLLRYVVPRPRCYVHVCWFTFVRCWDSLLRYCGLRFHVVDFVAVVGDCLHLFDLIAVVTFPLFTLFTFGCYVCLFVVVTAFATVHDLRSFSFVCSFGSLFHVQRLLLALFTFTLRCWRLVYCYCSIVVVDLLFHTAVVRCCFVIPHDATLFTFHVVVLLLRLIDWLRCCWLRWRYVIIVTFVVVDSFFVVVIIWLISGLFPVSIYIYVTLLVVVVLLLFYLFTFVCVVCLRWSHCFVCVVDCSGYVVYVTSLRLFTFDWILLVDWLIFVVDYTFVFVIVRYLFVRLIWVRLFDVVVCWLPGGYVLRLRWFRCLRCWLFVTVCSFVLVTFHILFVCRLRFIRYLLRCVCSAVLFRLFWSFVTDSRSVVVDYCLLRVLRWLLIRCSLLRGLIVDLLLLVAGHVVTLFTLFTIWLLLF
jgi:hypothetical protein